MATVEAGHSTAEQVAEAVVNLLTDRAHDLVVRIEIDGKRDAAGLADRFLAQCAANHSRRVRSAGRFGTGWSVAGGFV